MTNKPKIQIVRECVNKMHGVYILHYGVELGLFDAIKELGNPFTPNDIAKKLGYHAPFVDSWCQAAYAIDVLQYHEDDTYSISDEWLETLFDRKSCSFARYLPKCHVEIANFMSRLPESIKTGRTYGYDEMDSDFIDFVKEDGTRFTNCLIKDIIPKLPDFKKLLDEGGTVLDAGCGCAANLITLAKHFPRAKFIGADVSKKSVEKANMAIDAQGMSARINAVHSCAGEIEVDGPVDAITFIESLHEIEEGVRDKLFANCNRILNDNGFLVIIDCIGPENKADLNKPEYLMAAIVQWFEMIWGTKVPTRGEINGLLERHGFSRIEEIPLADATIAGIARKL